MISAVIIAEDTNREMQEDLSSHGINDHKLLLKCGGWPMMVNTVYNVLDADVDECLMVVGEEYHDIIKAEVEEIVRDNRLKFVKIENTANLEQFLLQGVNNAESEFCLFISADQPTVSPDTINNLVKKVVNSESDKTISILKKGRSKHLKSINKLKMPIVCSCNIFKRYLSENQDINLILSELNDNFEFYSISPIDDIELLKINNWEKYKRFLDGKNYESSFFESLKDFFSLKNLSVYFKIYLGIFVAFIIVSIILLNSGLISTGILNNNLTNTTSMLSTLIQIEAAIIAIIISLSIVAVQLTASAYSPRTMDIFKGKLNLWILIISYLIAIVYGLIILNLVDKVNSGQNLILVAIYLAVFTLFALIPYVLDILDLMKPSTIIDEIENGIKDSDVLYSIGYDEENPLLPLIDIINSALMKYDHGTLRNGLEAIERYNERLYENNSTFDSEKRRISENILDHLSEIGKLAINLKDDYATFRVLIAISINARPNLNNEKNSYLVFSAIFYIKEIGRDAAESDLNRATLMAVSALEDILRNNDDNFINKEISSAFDKIEELTTSRSIIERISIVSAMYLEADDEE